MGVATAYQCDGPGCSALATRAPGTRAPQPWPRVTLKLPNGTKASGSFHEAACAQAWLELELGINEEG